MTGLHSPTLTNPDMILPYKSPSSAPPFPVSGALNDSSTQPRGSHSLGSGDDGEETMRQSVRRLFSNGIGSQRKASSTSTARKSDQDSNGSIIHGENIPTHHSGHDGLLLASSPTFRNDYKSSSDAGSDDISNDHWEGFDGPIVETVVVSPHEADERVSLNGVQDSRTGVSTPDGNEPGLRSMLDEDENDPASHAAMSKKAEQILANAKKKLLTMENNLNRARSGLNGRPSSSMSSFGNHDHEPVSLYTIPGMHRSPDGFSSSKHRQGDGFLSSPGGKGHLRMVSESAVPSTLQTGSLSEKAHGDDRQYSRALNSTDIGSPGMSSSADQSSGASRNWFWTGLNRSGGAAGRLNNALEPLQEDEPAPASFGSPSQGSSPHSIEYRDQSIKSDHQVLSVPSIEQEGTRHSRLARARSTNQMRELRDQMQDLKGKISSLKQRAREDSMRRRSLQSLRTPSPFTAAEQWYGGSPDRQLGNITIITSNVEQKRSMSLGRKKGKEYKVTEPDSIHVMHDTNVSSNKEADLLHEYKLLSEQREDTSIDTSFDSSTNSRSSVLEIVTQQGKVPDRANGNIEDTEDDCSQDDQSEVQEYEFSRETLGLASSLSDVQEVEGSSEAQGLEQALSPIGERHEDRPDAFDYEHFYLHSAMGHYSRRKAKSRASSHSSVYSVETAKPYNDVAEEFSDSEEEDYDLTAKDSVSNSNSRPRNHLRQSSGHSVSTTATFATATEGRDEDGVSEDGWTNGRSMAGAWQSDYPYKRKFHINTSDTSPRPDETTPTQSSTNMALQPPRGRAILDQLSALPAFAPAANGISIPPLKLADGDNELLGRLIQSLSKVCDQLHIADAEGSGKYEGRQWRRRLDAARRVLEGEVNGEAF